MGVRPFNVRLTAFVLSAMAVGLAGALYADLNRFVSPTMLSWHVSGELMFAYDIAAFGNELRSYASGRMARVEPTA